MYCTYCSHHPYPFIFNSAVRNGLRRKVFWTDHVFAGFLPLDCLGALEIQDQVIVLKAFNPYYAFNLLWKYPGSILLLGAVFLCTTGAEALYADLGTAV